MDEVFLSYSLRKLSQHEVHQQGETTQSRDGLKLDRFHRVFGNPIVCVTKVWPS